MKVLFYNNQTQEVGLWEDVDNRRPHKLVYWKASPEDVLLIGSISNLSHKLLVNTSRMHYNHIPTHDPVAAGTVGPDPKKVYSWGSTTLGIKKSDIPDDTRNRIQAEL